MNQPPRDIVRLTMTAREAAERGQWDGVMQWYAERGELLQTMQLSAHEADELVRLDEQIQDRVHMIQDVLMALLDDTTATKQRLQGLRQRLGLLPSVPKTLSVEA